MVDIDKNSVRIILALAEDRVDGWRVNRLCERLGLEKYEVSRKVISLDDKGFVDRNDKYNIRLTEKGKEFARDFEDKIKKVTTHLEYEGTDSEVAERSAFIIAMSCDDEYFDRFDGQIGEMSRLKELYWDTLYPFGGEKIERNIKPGSYELSFMTHRVNVVNHQNYSMAKRGFHNSCKLLVDEKGGDVLIRIKEHEEMSVVEQRYISGKISELKYFDGEGWTSAMEGSIVRIPLKAFTFFNMGGSDIINGQIEGTVEIASRVEYEAGETKHNIPDHVENDGYVHFMLTIYLR